MNYTTLFETIQGYAENTFPNTSVNNTSASATTFTSKEQIDTFIQQAEQGIYNTVQMPAFRKNVSGYFTSGNRFLAVPSDWLSTFSLAVVDGDGDQHYLLNKDVNFIRESFPNVSSTGLPEYYAIFDDTAFIVGPTPDSSYNAELHYFYYPESIVTAGTSWLGDNFDSVLLYGSLLEAATFMKSEADVIQDYTTKYQAAMAVLKELGEAKNRQDMYRTQQMRYPVK